MAQSTQVLRIGPNDRACIRHHTILQPSVETLFFERGGNAKKQLSAKHLEAKLPCGNLRSEVFLNRLCDKHQGFIQVSNR